MMGAGPPAAQGQLELRVKIAIEAGRGALRAGCLRRAARFSFGYGRRSAHEAEALDFGGLGQLKETPHRRRRKLNGRRPGRISRCKRVRSFECLRRQQPYVQLACLFLEDFPLATTRRPGEGEETADEVFAQLFGARIELSKVRHQALLTGSRTLARDGYQTHAFERQDVLLNVKAATLPNVSRSAHVAEKPAPRGRVGHTHLPPGAAKRRERALEGSHGIVVASPKVRDVVGGEFL